MLRHPTNDNPNGKGKSENMSTSKTIKVTSGNNKTRPDSSITPRTVRGNSPPKSQDDKSEK